MGKRLRKRVILVLFLISALPLTGLADLSPVYGGTMTLRLFGSATGGWSLAPDYASIPGPEISVFAGEHVTLGLISVDGEFHRFGVDYNGNGMPDPDLGEPGSPLFNDTANLELDAPSEAGLYDYYCFIHPETMFGRFNVLERIPSMVGIAPGDVETGLGGRFRISVTAAGIQDLYAYTVGLSFDSSMLEVVSVGFDGTWMDESGRPYSPAYAPVVDNARGEVKLEVWIQGTFPGLTGSGDLAYVDFEAVATGRSLVDLVVGDTVLLDSQFRRIDYGEVDGNVSVLYAQLEDASIRPRSLRLGNGGMVNLEVVINNAGRLPVYAQVAVSWIGSRNRTLTVDYSGPVLVEAGMKTTISISLLPATRTDRYLADTVLLYSGRLAAPENPAWISGDKVSLSFRTISGP